MSCRGQWSVVNTVRCHVVVNGHLIQSVVISLSWSMSCVMSWSIVDFACVQQQAVAVATPFSQCQFVCCGLRRNLLRATHAGAVPASCHSLGTFISENIVANRRIKKTRRSFRGRRGGRAAVFFEYRSSVSATAVKHGSNKLQNIA